MNNKKTKLTISGKPKKAFGKFESSKIQGKKTVVIEKQNNKQIKKENFNKSFNTKPSSPGFKRGFSVKSNFAPKATSATSDFLATH